MKKIAFVWFWEQASEVMPNWRDGLRAAMEFISQNHHVQWFFDKEVPSPEDNFDIILLWSDDSCEFIKHLPDYSAKKGLFLTTNPHNQGNLLAFDAVFCESTPVLQEVRNLGAKGVKAFATDQEFFSPPIKPINKTIEYFYPATFSPWKRQSKIAYLGDKLLCVGTIQPDGKTEYQECIDKGVKVEVGYFPAIKIRNYYRKSKRVTIPAIHGSERTVLEAMSNDIVPTVNPENIKACSYLEELKESGLGPREFILKNYSAQKYANVVMEALI
jgi:hypothetical protein